MSSSSTALNLSQKPWEFALPSGRILRGIEVAAKAPGKRRAKKSVTLLVHGWMDNAASFQSLLLALPAHNTANPQCTYIAVDLAGHGLSDHLPPDGHYVAAQYALDVCDVLKALSTAFDRIGLVGHSLGAGVCVLAERAEVCKLDSLVLIEGEMGGGEWGGARLCVRI